MLGGARPASEGREGGGGRSLGRLSPDEIRRHHPGAQAGETDAEFKARLTPSDKRALWRHMQKQTASRMAARNRKESA